MSFLRTKILPLLFLVAACSAPKKLVKTTPPTVDSLRHHIEYLADDKLEGRRTGTNGEKLAMEYISAAFKTIGLEPRGSDEYYQAFDVNDGKQINPGTEFSINGTSLQAGKDFFPFPFCPNETLDALPAIALRETDMPWFVDLKETLEDNKDNPHFDLGDHIRTHAKEAKQRGAAALIFYNTSAIDDQLVFDPKDRSDLAPIPVLYVKKETALKFFKDPSATIHIKLKTDLSEKKRIGHNVIGYINNGAAITVILGAHFDHLGYGEDGNSMLRTGERLIHNGADDNASGTAALIELARMLKTSPAKNNNYLFIAFSGEELGLFGSKYFTDHPTVDLAHVNYMINMDMVGRLNDSSKVVTLGGYGTSPTWGEVFPALPTTGKTAIPLVFRYDSSGTGPSDHTSFYRKDIPVLFYFTGLHADYHRPTDDADKINYNGEYLIVEQIYDLIGRLNNRSKLVFTKTRETQSSSSARFSVTLGIMPDYTFTGSGVRADGISEGKAAQKAGLKAGDVILQLGENNVSSLENYMQALGKFKKGDKTKVKFKRGDQLLEADVQF